ncbi:hypothetical protein UA08_06744 [Talaromyces atroroseus]|uniref:Chromatin modification-related protein EAF6 n=1 Tax=Talaromyces atroroseus TaxID=1441469 RepID=A0A225ASV2_TALAT|nr:hypothetical protein UA08_06744 [Talaromyces atroroseus]OKL58036.1 hypothetical protein UA08_06744 [Talaromyces atroroseus]
MADTTSATAPNASASNNDNAASTNSTTANNNNNNNNTNQSQQNPSKNPGANPATPSAGAPATAANENRGLPYYEKLRRELRDTLQKKRLMDKSMIQLEDQIFRFEQSYLEDTSAGNIIKGFDNYIKGSSGTSGLSGGAGTLSLSGGAGAGGTARRKAMVSDNDRVFSKSSASFMRDSPTPSSAQTTPSHAPTPTSSHGGPSSTSNNAAGGGGGGGAKSEGSKGGSSKNKKKNSASTPGAAKDESDADVDNGSSKPAAKRLKISYGRD